MFRFEISLFETKLDFCVLMLFVNVYLTILKINFIIKWIQIFILCIFNST